MHTLSRNYEKSISYLLDNFPVVVLLGGRQVGKSTLLKRLRPEAHFFDLEDSSDFERIDSDPALIFKELDGCFIFDEAQFSPNLFKALRVEVDRDRQAFGKFLISGSSSPELLKNISESLAGRCAIVEINGFSWNEPVEKKQSDFYKLLSNNIESIKLIQQIHDHHYLLECCLYGQFPEPFLRRDDTQFHKIWMKSYSQTYIDRDIRTLFPNLKFDSFRRFVQMMAFSSGEILNFSNYARSLDVSQPTVKNYLEILEGTFLWRSLPTFDRNPKKRVIKMPKGHLRDTGLINHFLRIHTIETLKSHPNYGRIWESFIIEQIVKGFQEQLVHCDFHYYRTSNQTEVDLVIEGDFGIIPIEIKTGSNTSIKQLRGLQIFINDYSCPFGIVVNNADSVFLITDNIIQIPATYL